MGRSSYQEPVQATKRFEVRLTEPINCVIYSYDTTTTPPELSIELGLRTDL